MRELVIGDIHGCHRAFAALLAIVDPQPADTVILLGDYIDRGPDAYAVIEAILALRERCTVIALEGNHEQMLLEARTRPKMLGEWLVHGGRATLASYASHGCGPTVESIPDGHWQFFEQLRRHWETERYIFVHASVEPQLELGEQLDDVLFWRGFVDPTRHKSGKTLLCGHTSQKSGLPRIFDRGICLDSWAYGGGWLTCFDIAHNAFIQCNNAGELRTFSLRALLEHGNTSALLG